MYGEHIIDTREYLGFFYIENFLFNNGMTKKTLVCGSMHCRDYPHWSHRNVSRKDYHMIPLSSSNPELLRIANTEVFVTQTHQL